MKVAAALCGVNNCIHQHVTPVNYKSNYTNFSSALHLRTGQQDRAANWVVSLAPELQNGQNSTGKGQGCQGRGGGWQSTENSASWEITEKSLKAAFVRGLGVFQMALGGIKGRAALRRCQLQRQKQCAAFQGSPSLQNLGASHVEGNGIRSHSLNNLVSLSWSPCRMSPVKPDPDLVAVAGASSKHPVCSHLCVPRLQGIFSFASCFPIWTFKILTTFI